MKAKSNEMLTIRVSPQLHRAVKKLGHERETSIQDVAVRALTRAVRGSREASRFLKDETEGGGEG